MLCPYFGLKDKFSCVTIILKDVGFQVLTPVVMKSTTYLVGYNAMAKEGKLAPVLN
jgi:hypothetical protein